MSTLLLDNFHEELLYDFERDYGEYATFNLVNDTTLDYTTSSLSTDVDNFTALIIPLPWRLCADFFKKGVNINEKYERVIIVRTSVFTPKVNMSVTFNNVTLNIKEVMQQSSYVYIVIATTFNEG